MLLEHKTQASTSEQGATEDAFHFSHFALSFWSGCRVPQTSHHSLCNELFALPGNIPTALCQDCQWSGKEKGLTDHYIANPDLANIPDRFSFIKLVPFSDDLHSNLRRKSSRIITGCKNSSGCRLTWTAVCTWIPTVFS